MLIDIDLNELTEEESTIFLSLVHSDLIDKYATLAIKNNIQRYLESKIDVTTQNNQQNASIEEVLQYLRQIDNKLSTTQPVIFNSNSNNSLVNTPQQNKVSKPPIREVPKKELTKNPTLTNNKMNKLKKLRGG